jgi:glycosyltransferase involved in cell wall biosynthesis
LVTGLQRQAASLHIDYEILVADDGSTNVIVKTSNRVISQLPHCRYMERPENVGRAAIRNFLASQARYSWLLFIDGDMVLSHPDYLQQYLHITRSPSPRLFVAYGGLTIAPLQPGNLRSMYEHAAAPEHTLERRQQLPYHDFHTANFLIPRKLMLQHPFDERFRHYGYEDVLFGKQLQQHAIPIHHMDNPLSFERFEPNSAFVSKTEEGLRTLHQFQSDLRGYSRLLTLVSGIHIPLILSLIRLCHKLFQKAERRNLCSSRPSLFTFKLYRLGYFLSLPTPSAE